MVDSIELFGIQVSPFIGSLQLADVEQPVQVFELFHVKYFLIFNYSREIRKVGAFDHGHKALRNQPVVFFGRIHDHVDKTKFNGFIGSHPGVAFHDVQNLINGLSGFLLVDAGDHLVKLLVFGAKGLEILDKLIQLILVEVTPVVHGRHDFVDQEECIIEDADIFCTQGDDGGRRCGRPGNDNFNISVTDKLVVHIDGLEKTSPQGRNFKKGTILFGVL